MSGGRSTINWRTINYSLKSPLQNLLLLLSLWVNCPLDKKLRWKFINSPTENNNLHFTPRCCRSTNSHQQQEFNEASFATRLSFIPIRNRVVIPGHSWVYNNYCFVCWSGINITARYRPGSIFRCPRSVTRFTGNICVVGVATLVCRVT